MTASETCFVLKLKNHEYTEVCSVPNLVGVVISAAITALGLRAAVRHLRRENTCCDEGEYFPPSKELTVPIIGSKIVHLRGMHCENCQRRVEALLESIDGVSARADLVGQRALVSMSRTVTDEEIRAALAGSGYRVTEIKGIVA